jgi:hypothetical protein
MDTDLSLAIENSEVPPEIENYFPPTDVLYHVKGKHPQRNIFKLQEFTSVEVEKIRRLKEEIKKEKLKIPDEWDESELLKFVYGSNFKTRNAFKALKSCLDSRSEVFPQDYLLIYPKIYEILVKNK